MTINKKITNSSSKYSKIGLKLMCLEKIYGLRPESAILQFK